MEPTGPHEPHDAPQGASSMDVGLLDMHCHLLPGVDDGCQDVPESLECARRLSAAGFTHAICTPHVEPALPHNNTRQINEAVIQLQAALDAAQIPLKLLPGGEVRLGPNTMTRPAEELVLLCEGRSRGGRFLLFDTWEREWPDWLERTVTWLLQWQITPVMAHPERCAFVIEDPLDTAERLAELGVLLQLNCYVLGDEKAMKKGLFSKRMRHAAERMVEFDHYSFLATDTHRADTLDDRLAALEAARELMGSTTFRRLAKRNPLQLLPG